MKHKLLARILSIVFSISLVLSMTQISFINAFADSSLLEAAKAYVKTEGNNVTREGLLAAVKLVRSDAELSDSDFFIKHAVNGVKDDDKDYPLNIPGSNGAVAAVFTVGTEKVGFSAAIGHEVENLKTNKTVVVSKDNKDFSFNKNGNVIGYSGDAEKIVIPADTTIVITSQAKLDNVKVVIVNNEASQPASDTEVGVKDASTFAGWQNLVAVQYNGVGPYWFTTKWGEGTFKECRNLKYVKCPSYVHIAVGTADYIGVDTFLGCSSLENIILPDVNIPWGAPTAVAKNAFSDTAVRDFFLPGKAGAVNVQNDIGSFDFPSFEKGMRNVITYNTDMTFVRAVALVAAKVSEVPSDTYVSDVEKLIIAKNAIVGSHDAAEFLTTLSFKRNGSDKMTIECEDGSIDIDFTWTDDIGENILEGVKKFISKNGNNTTEEGIAALIATKDPKATVSSFFIKHAVPGVIDNDKKYPLDIPGTDGAVAVIFTVDGVKYNYSTAIPHEVETFETNKTVVVSKENKDFTFNKNGNVTGYSGDAEKIVIPADTTFVITPQAKLNNVKVVIINNEVSQPAGENEVGVKDVSSFAGWKNLTAVQYNVKGPFWFTTNLHEPMFKGCENLKYIKCPDYIYVGVGIADYMSVDTFNGCSKLENIILPDVKIGWGNPTSVATQAFSNTAVRDFFLPGEAGAIKVEDSLNSFFNPSFEKGSRNVITYDTDMTITRAAALAQSKASEVATKYGITDIEALDEVKRAITGSHDAADYLKSLTFERVGTDKVSISDGIETILIDFKWTVTLESLSVVGFDITPAFDPFTYDYTLNVPNDVKSVTVEAVAVEDAEIESGLGVYKNLAIGVNNIKVETTINGRNAIYNIAVTRKSSETLDLNGLAEKLEKEAPLIECTGFVKGTTEESFKASVKSVILGYGEFEFEMIDYYKLDPVEGAIVNGEVVVPGHDGYITAIVRLTSGKQSKDIPLMVPIKAPIQEYTFTEDEISKDSDFTLSSDKKTVKGYDGDAKMIVIPDGVKTIAWEWNESENPENAIVMILPDSVEEIPEFVCKRMRNIEVFRMGDAITILPNNAFECCIFLRYVKLSNNLTTISDYAFSDTPSLGSLHIPDTLQVIGTCAFNYSVLRNITLPANMQVVSDWAFCYPPNHANCDQWKLKKPEEYDRLKEIVEIFAERHLNGNVGNEDYSSTSRCITFLSPDTYVNGINVFGTTIASSHCARFVIRQLESGTVLPILEPYMENGYSPYFTFEPLNMSLCESAARAQYKADSLAIYEETTDSDVLSSVKDSYFTSRVNAPVWVDELIIDTDTQKVTGTMKLSATDSDYKFNITINKDISSEKVVAGSGSSNSGSSNSGSIGQFAGFIRKPQSSYSSSVNTGDIQKPEIAVVTLLSSILVFAAIVIKRKIKG